MSRDRVIDIHGAKAYRELVELLCAQKLDLYNPIETLVIGDDTEDELGDLVQFLTATKEVTGEIVNFLAQPSVKAPDGGRLLFCLGSEENTRMLIALWRIGQQDPNGDWIVKPRNLKNVVILFPTDEQLKYLPLLLENTDITVYVVHLRDSEDPHKDGFFPRTVIEGFEGIPAEVDLEAEEDADHELGTIPDDAMYGEAKKIARMLKAPIGFGYLAVICGLSVRVAPISTVRPNLFGMLVGDVGEGKTVAKERTEQILGLVNSGSYESTTPASDRGLLTLFPGPETKPFLLALDEARAAMEKGSIQSSTLISGLCELWSRDSTGVADKKGVQRASVRLSILGNLKIKDPSEFPAVFTHATAHGFYDRCLFAVRGGEKWRYSPWEFESMRDEHIPSFSKLPAIKQHDGTYKTWCKFCRRWHFHGSLGVKTSHCRDSASPYDVYELIEEASCAKS
ncbi:MAG: hypothetical protein DMG80_11995 [Acidobacteria bacterium]|nr:MAG: hypothetical protein DMG80_11995 [Acidobacteriota bacterium]